MRILKPKKLTSGDLIGIISPGSSSESLSKLNNGVNYLEKLGYRVELGKHVGEENGYLAGNDSHRLNDLHGMFNNKEVKAIFTVRGGYGSSRLLNKINYSLIRKNPKIFVGFSDITVLQMAIFKYAGLVTFAGPMVAVDFAEEINEFTEENFWKTLTSSKKIGKIHNPNEEKFYVLNKGRGEGRLLGGNLTLFMSLFGTDYLPSMKDKILMLEEIGEAPYRIDRMFNQMKLAKIFKQIKGLILGRFVDCYETDSTKKSYSLNEVIMDYFNNIKLPVLYNFKHGHIKDKITVPIGVNCKLNTSRCFVEIPENAVS